MRTAEASDVAAKATAIPMTKRGLTSVEDSGPVTSLSGDLLPHPNSASRLLEHN
jgi:hypothetical protein